jgi:LysM repeat protein/TolA-binding protein
MKGFRAAALGISWIAGTAVGLPSLAEGMVGSNLSPTGVAAQLRALGCSPSPAAPATLEAVRAAIRGCLADPALSNANRTQLTALERDLIKAFPSGGGAGSGGDLAAVLASFQSQIDQLRLSLKAMQQDKEQQDLAYRQREQQLTDTISKLRAQVSALDAQRTMAPAAVASAGVSAPSVPSPPGAPAATAAAPTAAAPTAAAAAPAQPAEPPKFKPTLTISGSVNMLVGGVTGSSTSLSRNYWGTRTRNANRDFSNTAAEISANVVTGATNKAGGQAYAYYRSGQSDLFYPPNGLDPVNKSTAQNYSMASSWTGGKVRFDSLSRGGNLIITDPTDPNYNATNPRTLDRAGYNLSVNLQGQPTLPNSGLGGLKNPSPNFQPVSASDFNLSNLGADITFANIPMGQKDIQKLIDLGNRSRQLKLGGVANQTKSYTVKAGDSISTIAFANGTTVARLLELNPSLPPSAAANAVLKQGSALTVPTVGCVNLCQGLNTVANGGLVQNTAFYDDLLNLAIAEYGSLTSAQQNSPQVKQAAQSFVRNLVGTGVNENLENEDFNFQRSYTFNNDVKLTFTNSFIGTDLLGVTLRYRNIVPYGERGRFPALNLAYGFGSATDASVQFDRLWWKLPVTKDTSLWLGTRYKDYYFLPVRYGTFYPVEQQNYFFASGAGLADYVGAGAGFTVNNLAKNVLGGTLSIGGGYIANPVDALNPVSNSFQQLGIAGRDTRFRAPLQLGYLSNDGKVMSSLNYIYNRGDTLNAFVGTNLSANPFFFDIDQYSQLGATFAWQFMENISINFVYNHFSYTARYDASVFGVPMVQAGDTAKAQSWMAALLFEDLIVANSQAGLAIGQVPSIYANSSAWGTERAPLAFEAWYNYPFSDRINIQPAFFLITNHDGYSNGGTDWGSTFRIYFNF